MIIFGTRGVTLNGDQGDFHCPACQGTRPFKKKTVRRFFTLYFIPLIPLDKLGEYVECQQCGNQFRPEVLDIDPEAERSQARTNFAEHVKRILVLVAVADDAPTDDETEEIIDIVEKLGGGPLANATLQKEYTQARSAGVTAADYARRFADDLNEHGKELVMKAAIQVAQADDAINVAEEQLLDDLAVALNMSQAHYKGILNEMDI